MNNRRMANLADNDAEKDSWDLLGVVVMEVCNWLLLRIIDSSLRRWLTHFISSALCYPPSRWATDGIQEAILLFHTPASMRVYNTY